MNGKKTRVVFAALVLLAVAAALAAQAAKAVKPKATTKAADAAAAKEQDIRKLMQMTGSANMGLQVMDNMIAQFKKMMPQVPNEFWTDFRNEINAKELTDLIVPIYARHFSHDDIKQLIAFYNTPIGKKLIALQPQIMQESMAAGQKWGAKIGQRAMKKIQDRKKKQGGNLQP